MEGEKYDDISDNENNKCDDGTPVLDLAGIEIRRHSVNRPCMNEPLQGLPEIQRFPPRIAVFELGGLRPETAVIEIRCTKDCKRGKTLSRNRYKHTIKR